MSNRNAVQPGPPQRNRPANPRQDQRQAAGEVRRLQAGVVAPPGYRPPPRQAAPAPASGPPPLLGAPTSPRNRRPPNPAPATRPTAPGAEFPPLRAATTPPQQQQQCHRPPSYSRQAAPETRNPTDQVTFPLTGAGQPRPPPPIPSSASAVATPVTTTHKPWSPEGPSFTELYKAQQQNSARAVQPFKGSILNQNERVGTSERRINQRSRQINQDSGSVEVKLGIGINAKFVRVAKNRKAATRLSSTVSLPDEELSSQFLEFIKTFVADGERGPYYKAQAFGMHIRGIFQLEVNFEHILKTLNQDTKILNLVLHIGNSYRHSWLNPIIASFLLEVLEGKEGYADLTEFIDTKSCDVALVTFINKPKRVQKLSDALTTYELWKIVNVIADRCSILCATTQGRSIFRAVISELVELFKQDKWLPGEICIDDFILLDSVKCWIMKSPESASSSSFSTGALSKAAKDLNEGKIRNLNDVWKMMEKYYAVDGMLPMYFENLKESLTMASTDNVKEVWFLTYLVNQFALVSSMARRAFTCESSKACRMFGPIWDSRLNGFVTSKAFADWRMWVYYSGDSLLNDSFWYGLADLEKFKDIAQHIRAREYSKIHFSYYERARDRSVGSFLDFKRNVLQHLQENFAKEMTKNKVGTSMPKVIKDMDEVELFTTICLPLEVDDGFLRDLLENFKENEGFHGILSAYLALAKDMRDLPGSS